MGLLIPRVYGKIIESSRIPTGGAVHRLDGPKNDYLPKKFDLSVRDSQATEFSRDRGWYSGTRCQAGLSGKIVRSVRPVHGGLGIDMTRGSSEND